MQSGSGHCGKSLGVPDMLCGVKDQRLASSITEKGAQPLVGDGIPHTQERRSSPLTR